MVHCIVQHNEWCNLLYDNMMICSHIDIIWEYWGWNIKHLSQNKHMFVYLSCEVINFHSEVLIRKHIAKLSTSQPANPQLGAEIALISQLSWTTHTPTQESSFEFIFIWQHNMYYGFLEIENHYWQVMAFNVFEILEVKNRF